jgi:hypothetical protein
MGRKVVATTDCLLYKWNIEAVEMMADRRCPALAAAWRNLALYSVGAAFSSTCGDVRIPNEVSPIISHHHITYHSSQMHASACDTWV